MKEIVKELRIRRDGGHEGAEELEMMCGKAADHIEELEKRLRGCEMYALRMDHDIGCKFDQENARGIVRIVREILDD